MAKLLRLVLGDQLNRNHSWFSEVRPDVVYVMMEVRQETDYVLHHAQKIIAIFAAMRDFADHLQQCGHQVHYLRIGAKDNLQSLPGNLDMLLKLYDARRIEWQAPDEWRLDQQLRDYASAASVPAAMVDSEHFYTARDEVGAFFRQRRQWVMEAFYRHMRKRHGILLDLKGSPAGGQWNYDHDNREAWQGLPWEPADCRPRHDHSLLWKEIQDAGVRSFGAPQAERFRWPLNEEEALHQLDEFVQHALPHFGRFQDAMSYKAWRLFHSLLSFAMNVKLLNPRAIIARVEAAWREGKVPLPSAEGYIRQILGWREYVRGVYWHRMPGYEKLNAFNHDKPLPGWFWDGQTRMRCLATAVGQSLEHAHSHHINRLMVIGNFALLAGLSPQEVHQWYLGVYIDAFEWVELPNTLGMSQYADGGLLATKPYVSTAAYIHRMSDYCKGCQYDRKLRVGDRACPYNAMYWDFFLRNQERLGDNHRLGIVYRQLQRMSEQEIAELQEQATRFRENVAAL